MKPHNKIMAQIALEKSDDALKMAFSTIDESLATAQNRAYYAVFYTVLALAYIDDFVTKSHHKLMGQFNKKYIYEQKVFDKSVIKIYSTLILNRETADYDLTSKPVKEDVIKDVDDAKVFIDLVRPYILKRLNEK